MCCMYMKINIGYKNVNMLFWVSLKRIFLWGAWVAPSVKRPTSAQVMISRSVSSSPASGSMLTQLRAWSLFQILCLPLSDPPPFMLSVSKINKH